ncbi:MAG: hypothetical protein ACI9SE_001153 [Neolewinella sp.]|jgi:hypothetical protein
MVARVSQWGPLTGSGTPSSTAGSRRHVSGAECRLAQPGILLEMVGPDLNEHSSPASRRQVGDVQAEAGSLVLSAIAISAGAAAIGAIFASLALAHQVALQDGAVLPATSWLHSLRDWLPLLCIGFGVARLAVGQLHARTAFRGLGIGAIFALATSMAWFGPDVPWMLSAVACVIGAVLGLHCESARRAGRTGVVVAGLVAAVSAFAACSLAPLIGGVGWCAADVLGVALCGSLVALVLDAPQLAPMAAFGNNWRWLALGWFAVAALVAVTAMQADAGHWVLMSVMIAVVVTAAAACQLALALGATVAMVLISSGAVLGNWVDPLATEQTVVLRQVGSASAVYIRSDQELQLRLDGEVVAAAGPNRNEEPLMAAILHAAAHPGDRVLLLGDGTGRVGTSLRRTGRYEVESATAWPELAALQPTVAADGPVQQPRDPNERIPQPWHKALANLPSGSRQVIVLGELPSLATVHRASGPFQRQLRRVAGDGLVCQPIALDRISASLLESWFDVVAKTHAWNGIYAVGNAAVLVSASRKPTWRSGLAGWRTEARWAMHRAHLIGPEDLEVAFLGAVKQGAVKQRGDAAASRGPDRDVARQLMRWLAAPESVAPASQLSLLRRWQQRTDQMTRAKGRLLTISNDAAGRAQAQSIAARFVPMGAPAPWLQAALGLAGVDGVALRDPSLASRCAYAMDPTFFITPAAVYASLPLPMQERGDLEDLFLLDDGPILVRRCVGTSPQAVALRARFPSRCARSLVAQLAQGPLEHDAATALRELADPFVLREIASVVAPLGRWGELLTFWRADLPLPTALQQIAITGTLADRRLLASALRGRRDPSCYPAIAEFLVAEDLELRRRAGEALRMAVGERVRFDAHWPRTRRLDAATRLRDLHNRKP